MKFKRLLFSISAALALLISPSSSFAGWGAAGTVAVDGTAVGMEAGTAGTAAGGTAVGGMEAIGIVGAGGLATVGAGAGGIPTRLGVNIPMVTPAGAKTILPALKTKPQQFNQGLLTSVSITARSTAKLVQGQKVRSKLSRPTTV